MYEFELEEKASKTKERLFILLYVILLVAVVVIGTAIKLQQIKTYELQHSSTKTICKACVATKLNIPAKTQGTTTTTPGGGKSLAALNVNLQTTDCIGPNDSLNIRLDISNTLKNDLPLEKTIFLLPTGFEYLADSAKVNGTIVPVSNLEIEQTKQNLTIRIKILADYLPLQSGKALQVTLKARAKTVKTGTYTIKAAITATNYNPLDGIKHTFKVNDSCKKTTTTPPPTSTTTISPAATTTAPPSSTITQGTSVTPPETGIVEIINVLITLLGIGLIALGIDLYLAGYKIKSLAPVYDSLIKLDYNIRTRILKIRDPISYFELKLRNYIKLKKKKSQKPKK